MFPLRSANQYEGDCDILATWHYFYRSITLKFSSSIVRTLLDGTITCVCIYIYIYAVYNALNVIKASDAHALTNTATPPLHAANIITKQRSYYSFVYSSTKYNGEFLTKWLFNYLFIYIPDSIIPI